MSSSDTTSSDESFMCIKCGKLFELPEDLKEHFTNQHLCRYCAKALLPKRDVRRHEKIHTREKPFVCDACGEKFNRKHILDNHKEIHTSEVHHFCEECGKTFTFTREIYVNDHKMFHAGEMPHICEVCGRTYSFKSQLTKRKKTHTEETPHVCDNCGKAYKHKWHLKKHMLSCITEKAGKIEGMCSSEGSSATPDDTPNTSQN